MRSHADSETCVTPPVPLSENEVTNVTQPYICAWHRLQKPKLLYYITLTAMIVRAQLNDTGNCSTCSFLPSLSYKASIVFIIISLLYRKMHVMIILFIFTLSVRAQTALAFTRVPTSIVIGQPTLLEWDGGDNSVSD